MDAIAFLLQALLGLGGTLFAYVAAFTYEDADCRIQDRLEGWWVRFDDFEGTFASKVRKLLIKSNESVDSALSSLFGKKLISLRFVTTSVLFSITVAPLGGLLVLGTWMGLGEDPVHLQWPPLLISFSAILLILQLGKWMESSAVCTIVFTLLCVALSVAVYFSSPLFNLLVPSIALVNLAFDTAVLLLVRSLVRWRGQRNPLLVALLLSLSVFAAFAFITLPLLWLLLDLLGFFVVIIPFFYVPVLLIAGLFLAMPLFLLLGRLLFTVTCRGVYSVQRSRLVFNKKAMWSLSLLFFSGVPVIAPMIQRWA